jgi:adenylosuccinate lyase
MGGLVFSQQVMLALVEKGVSRDDAYKLVQRNAAAAWQGASFKQQVLADSDIRAHLSESEIDHCFDLQYHLKHLDHTFEQLGI